MTDWKYSGFEMPAKPTEEEPLSAAGPEWVYKGAAEEEEDEDEDEDEDEEEELPQPQPALGTLIDKGFHHSSFLAGKPAAAAGEIRAKNGVLELISNSSGHYRPSIEYLKQVFLEFRDRGYDFGAHKCVIEDAAHGDEKSKQTDVDAKAVFGFTKEILEKKLSRSVPAPEKSIVGTFVGENKKSKTVGRKIRYLTPDELKKHQLTVENKIVKRNGKPFDTYGGVIYGSVPMKDRYIFVMSPAGEIYASNQWAGVQWLNNPWVAVYQRYYYEHRAKANRAKM